MSTRITGTLVWYYAICPREARLMAHEVAKVLKFGREYLDHIQNSVREGELSPAQYKQLKHEAGEAINPERDSVRFYVLRTTTYLDIEKFGVPSRPGDAEAFL
jgi:CRISPR-associated protein Cas2